MERKAVVSCAVVVGFAIISTATGFVAELTKVKLSDIKFRSGDCDYPSSPALALGLVSAIFAVITQIYINVAFGGCCCCQQDANVTSVSILFSILSWIATVISVILLSIATSISGEACHVVTPGLFAGGASLAFLSAVFGIFAYVTITSQTRTYPQQYPPQQYTPQQYPPQQYIPQQYPPQQYPPQQYPQHQFTAQQKSSAAIHSSANPSPVPAPAPETRFSANPAKAVHSLAKP